MLTIAEIVSSVGMGYVLQSAGVVRVVRTAVARPTQINVPAAEHVRADSA